LEFGVIFSSEDGLLLAPGGASGFWASIGVQVAQQRKPATATENVERMS
jgi:hypothetical protein